MQKILKTNQNNIKCDFNFYDFTQFDMKRKVLVIIRDWRGYRADPVDNAIAEVDTPNTDMIMGKYPNMLINASGENVWLPAGYQWNSEVWHMTIWSGRVIFQSLERINRSIKDWS